MLLCVLDSITRFFVVVLVLLSLLLFVMAQGSTLKNDGSLLALIGDEVSITKAEEIYLFV